MRGGTSKGIYIHDRDLPRDARTREAVLLRLFGSPDVRQIDGLGGGDVLTSKLAVVRPSLRTDAHVDYTFGQISMVAPFIDWGGNCGNISAGVGPFAIDEGLVDTAGDGICEVRIYQTNTDAIIVARVPAEDGAARVFGDCQISGVPGTGAGIELDFSLTAGSSTGCLLPTGSVVDVLETAGGPVDVSIVDAGILTVFLKASDIGLTGFELPTEVEGKVGLLDRMEEIRGAACVKLGLVTHARDAATKTPYTPFIAAVAPPQPYTDFTTGETVRDSHLLSRLFFMQRLHKAYPVTGTIATGAAAKIPGTLVHQANILATDVEGPVRIGHPSGTIDVDIRVDVGQGEPTLSRAVLLRTARRIMDGTAYVPPDVWSCE